MITNKQLKHYKTVLQSGLDKFIKCCDETKTDSRFNLIKSEWERLIADDGKIKDLATYIDDFPSLIGFTRELSSKLGYEQLVGRVAERFAELDLAVHSIREFGLKKSKHKLQKLSESGNKTCDFKLPMEPPYYMEAKYTISPTKNNIYQIAKEALEQIKSTDSVKARKGCVWIFTYQDIKNPQQFQSQVMDVKRKLSSSYTFPFRLNVQVYSRDLYGDATIIL